MNRFEILKQPENTVSCYAPVLPPSKEEIIADLLATTEGQRRLAASMARVRRGWDYESVARRAFGVESIPAGPLIIPEGSIPEEDLSQVRANGLVNATFINCTMTVA